MIWVIIFTGVAMFLFGSFVGYVCGHDSGYRKGYCQGFEKADAQSLKMRMAMDTRYTSPDC